MALRSILKFGIKYGSAGGVTYYAYDLGLWKNSDDTIKNYANFKTDVNAFLESSPALVEYLKGAKDSITGAVKPAAESLSSFRKDWLNVEFEYPESGVVATSWNKSVSFLLEGIASTPETITNLTINGWEQVTQLVGDENTSSDKTSS